MPSEIPTSPAKAQEDSFHSIPDAQSLIHVSPADTRFAEDTFESHGLTPEKTIALFAGGQSEMQDYAGFGAALAMVCQERGFKVIALGSAREQAINLRNFADLGAPGIDLTGRTTVRQAVEIVRRCRLAVGTESGLAHIAVAVGIPNVVVLGGGQFGQSMPRSPLTTAVCLPLDCFGCGWRCPFRHPHCVRDVSPSVMAVAIRIALDRVRGQKPRVVAQDRSLWGPVPGGPGWAWFHGRLDRQSFELITVGKRDKDLVVSNVIPPRRHAGPARATEANARRLNVAREFLQATTANLPAIFRSQAALVQDKDTADLPASPEEWMFLDEIRSGLARGDNDPYALNYRTAALLYFRAHELEPWEPARIPPWFVEDFILWTIHAPGLFYDLGEKDEYHRRIEAWFLYMRDQIRGARDPSVRQRLAELTCIRLNLIPVYFASASLKRLFLARGECIAAYLSDRPLDFVPPPRSGARIRVGIVKLHWSASTETYATLPLFEHLPRDRFEVFLYTVLVTDLPAETHCKSKADRFIVLPPELMQQVNLIRGDRCDFLFFATNLTAVTHPLVLLAAFRLAPVQATSICSPATTGFPRMDVFLAGELTEKRADAQEQYHEKLIKLPGSGICFDYSLRPPPSQYEISRAQLNLNDSTIVFTSGANFFKIIPELRRTWARVLASAPNTVLMLYPFGPEWTNSYPGGSFIQSFHEELRAAGVDVNRLILLSPMTSPSDVKKVMALTNIYLDSFPYTGATSLLDPLEAGIPPITMTGDRLRFAQGEALMRELGMPEQVATSEEHYIQLAAELARDPELLKARRAKVRERMAARPPFLDTERFCAHVANAIESLVGPLPG